MAKTITKYINLSNNTSFNFTHTINNKRFKLHILYNTKDDNYYMNVEQLVDGVYVELINGISLTTGVNLFCQFGYLGLGTLMVIPMLKTLYDQVPKAETITNNFALLWQYEEAG